MRKVRGGGFQSARMKIQVEVKNRREGETLSLARSKMLIPFGFKGPSRKLVMD